MKNIEFNIIVNSNDSDFSIRLATECDKYGFLLSFIDKYEDFIKFDYDESYISVIILDINDSDENKFELCKKIRTHHEVPVFAVMDKLNTKLRSRAKKHGFDLIISKKMFLSSIREVIIHVSK